jgi:hypothetical protein
MFLRYNDPGNDIGNQPDADWAKGEHHPQYPDQVRVGIVLLADPAADAGKEPFRFRAVEPFHERELVCTPYNCSTGAIAPNS